MGQGGGVTLFNGTKYHWCLAQISSTGMNTWPFPQIVPPGTSTGSLYVEFSDSDSPSATATYALNGLDARFEVRASYDGDYDISVALQNIQAGQNPPGGIVDLGWNHDGDVYFVLGGEVGQFSASALLFGSWMQDNLPMLGARTLRELCMPGTHDSGMNDLSPLEALWAGTQNLSVLAQLQSGARYFDIRPARTRSGYVTAHYTGSTPGSFGTTGQTIPSIISDINQFTAGSAELIILNLSHDIDLTTNDVANFNFTQGVWNDFMEQLTTIEARYLAANPPADVTQLTLNDFIGGGKAAVLLAVQPNDSSIHLGAYASLGFYDLSRLAVNNNYANTDEVDAMQASQFSQMRQLRPTRDSEVFVLSWTLTQQSASDAPISSLAAAANATLDVIPSQCSYDSFPNIVYVDYLPANLTALVMLINCIASYPADLRTSPPVAVAASSSTIALLYRDAGSRLWLATAGSDLEWGTPVQLQSGINSAMAPAATYWNEALVILYRGSPGDQTIWYATEASNWNTVPLHESTIVTPSIAATTASAYGLWLSSMNDGTLYLASCPGSQSAWNASNQLPTSFTTFITPAVAVMQETLYALYRSTADETLWAINYNGSSWSDAATQLQPQHVTTLWSAALTAMGGKLYAVYRSATDYTMWTTNSADGVTWTLPTQLPSTATTLFAPAVTVFQNVLYVFFASSTDTSIQQVSSSDGITWQGPVTVLTTT